MNEPRHLLATILPAGHSAVDLWIVDGRFTFQPQPGAPDVAPPGGFVAAGLVDSHTHLHFVGNPAARSGPALVEENRRAHLHEGTLLLRDLGASSDDVLGLSDDDGLPIVRAAGQSLLIEPRHPFRVTAARELSSAVSLQAQAGARWVKIFADWPGWLGKEEEPNFGPRDALTYPGETLAEAVVAAHAAGARVAIHAFGREAASAGIEAGVDSIEHGWGLDEALLEEMARKRIAWTPMLGIAPGMRSGAQKTNTTWQVEWIDQTMARLEILLPLAHRLGVPILAGTDWFPSVKLVDEIRLLHRHGLEPTAALATATSAARAFLREPGIEEQAPADLVLYRQDPRQDLRLLANPELVMLRGRVVPRTADDRLAS